MLRAHLTPAHTCIHTLMHVHCFRADFHLKQWEIYSKFKAARTKHFFFFFPREKTDLKPFSDLIIYVESCRSIPLLQKWRCRYYVQVSFVRKERNPPDFGISSKQFLQRTQDICFALYQNLQAAREQIHLLLCFLTMKCRLSFPALLRVTAATSLSVCLS